MRGSLAEVERILEQTRGNYEAQLEALSRDATLERYRALDRERKKWEARETKLVEQLEAVKCDHKTDSELSRLLIRQTMVQIAKTKISHLEEHIANERRFLELRICVPQGGTSSN